MSAEGIVYIYVKCIKLQNRISLLTSGCINFSEDLFFKEEKALLEFKHLYKVCLKQRTLSGSC